MAFAVPSGAQLIAALGAGSFFEVALVESAGRRCLCKRLRARMRGEPLARAAFTRESEVLSRARHAALPQIVAVGEDEQGPWLIESAVSGSACASWWSAGRGAKAGRPSAACGASRTRPSRRWRSSTPWATTPAPSSWCTATSPPSTCSSPTHTTGAACASSTSAWRACAP